MTFLELINNTLTRLREDTITEEQLVADNDPYFRFIASAVNDAKDRVEDAWQWGALRGTDSIGVDDNQGDVAFPDVALTNSRDNDYIIKSIAAYPNTTGAASLNNARNYLQQITVGAMRGRYQDPLNAGTGRPSQYAVTGTAKNPPFDAANAGDIKITLWPFPTNVSGVGDYWLEVDRVNHQPTLTLANDVLLVPSLPVYTLATALSSRERGEVGGTPTSELFEIATRHLADAVAQDSALYSNELDWFADTNLHNTNVRFA